MLRLRADWVLPVSAPPIADGAVLVDGRGRIDQVGRADDVPTPPDARTEDLGAAVLLPGLVNTHSHLELTGFAGQVEDDDFWQWILQVIAIKAARSEEGFFEAACAGVRGMWAAGVTTVCDTGSTGAVLQALDHLGASGISHHEVFGAHPNQCTEAMRGFTRDLDRLARHATGRCRLGVSPHAPYTVSAELYRASSDLARAHGVPMAVHVAEPPGERQLLADFSGIFADSWRAQGIPRPSAGPVSPMAFMDRNGVLSERTLCIHAIDVDVADTALMVRRGVAVAHCPRSNRRHHGTEAPIERFHRAGLRVGLGTDSEISVDPPDLLAEARQARALAGWSAAGTLRSLTLGGAEAIGLGSEIGSLERGKWADLVALPVVDGAPPEEAVLAASRGDVRATWLAGREVVRAVAG
jgi:5-methylthioadenosine/S-adenosylhomocysteine deaminase